MQPMVPKSLLVFLAAARAAHGELEIEAMKHDIQKISPMNFDGIIGKFRDSAVSSLWFYKDTKEDAKFLDLYNDVAKDLKGMAKICAISCDENEAFCSKPKVILFSSKDKPPTILKALSSETVFKRTVKFGFVSQSDKDMVSKFKVKDFPSILLQK